jgi:voltage-gated potassium channel
MFKLLSDYRRIAIPLFILFILLVIGTIGYTAIESYNIFDAFYMTIITMSTVGYEEVNEMGFNGRLFTSFLIIFSFGTFAYAISSITGFIADGEFKKVLNKRRMDSALNDLNNHVIVCGYGRNGRQATQVLIKHNTPFAVIENNVSLTESIDHKYKHLIITGDSTRDEILLKAGIHRAKALITTLPVDADNLYIVLTAKNMNPNLTIISRASEDGSDAKLKIAGATNVIMPDKVGGVHMASLVMKPDVMEFLDALTSQNDRNGLEEILLNNVVVSLKDKTLQDLEVLNNTGAKIVGFKTALGEYVVNPSPETRLVENAKLFVLGNQNQISKLKQLLIP